MLLPRSIDLPAVSLTATAHTHGEILSHFTQDHLVTLGRTAARQLLTKIGQRRETPI